MKTKTPPRGEVSREMPGSYTRDNHSPITLRHQFLIDRFPPRACRRFRDVRGRFRGGTLMDYPNGPGAKGLTGATYSASADAADAIASSRERLWWIAIRTLAVLGEAAPLEVVAASGVKASALQPRMSECIAEGLMEPTGERRRNPETNKTAAVLILTEKARERLNGGAA